MYVWIYIFGRCVDIYIGWVWYLSMDQVVCRDISWIVSWGHGPSLISQLAAATTVHKMGFRERTTAAAVLCEVHMLASWRRGHVIS